MTHSKWFQAGALIVLAGAMAGCPLPPDTSEYDAGFADGFAQDDWYWQGYDDSYATMAYAPLYYQGGTIPVGETSYDEGYWDGVWWAYNDGYFVCYDYAFTIGFSEGYDAAFYDGYLQFLANDHHTENDNGGWGDGYNDGFSEGRCLGANDYEQDLAFDWLDALLDYRDGTDIYFEEIDVGTGAYGPVILYEYGTDPGAGKSIRIFRAPSTRLIPSIRHTGAAKADTEPELSYRPLPQEVQQTLNVQPLNTPRSSRPLTITTTWLDRVNAYRQAIGEKSTQ